jgi:DNA-binding PucR family transcriptional regulator
VVAFLAADPGDANAAGRLTAAVRQSAGRMARTPARERLCVGVSGPASSLRALTEEARQARRVAECSPARVAVLTRDEVDSHVVLLAGLPGSLRTGYHRRLLTPVVEYDARHRTELLQTLECFLEHSGSWSVAAQKLHVHVNTLRYRVGRIEQLTGRTLTRLEHQVDLFLALRARG